MASSFTEMNEQDKNCAREILSGLEEKDILELTKTVTKAKFTPKDKQEGIELIVRYESDLKSLLSRKKMSTNLLVQYLHAKGIQFNIDGSKLSLCDRIIQHWNSFTQVSPLRNAITGENVCKPASIEYSSTYSDNYQVAVALSETDVTNLGHQFVDWFFSLLRGPELELVGMGSQHFFSDASCRILIGDEIREGVGGDCCASTLVESLRCIGGAVPLPNPSGVRSQTSPHGAVKVVACGTLHAPQNRMLGAFEQAFLLVRDPSTPDNWKIKFTEMRLKAESNSNAIEPPSQPSIQL